MDPLPTRKLLGLRQRDGVAGYPTDDTELAIMKSLKAVGYSK